jgi:hypothetical protein
MANSQDLQDAQSLPFGFLARSGLGIPYGLWVFPINPEDYTINYPTKGNITQTVGGNYEDYFGMGVPQGNIRGTFGFQARIVNGGLGYNPTDFLPGQAQFKVLETLFKTFYNFTQEIARQQDITMDFFSLSDGHYFKVRILNFQFDRSIRHQFLYRYDIRFAVLRDYFQAAIASIIGTGLSSVLPSDPASSVALSLRTVAG